MRILPYLFRTAVVIIAIFILAFQFFYLQYGYSRPQNEEHSAKDFNTSTYDSNTIATSKPDPEAKELNASRQALTSPYIHAIMDSADSAFPRLHCPSPSLQRYEYLQPSLELRYISNQPEYFFALDLHQCVHVLPRLMNSIIEAIRFLGPERCVLSVVEGGSNDGTFEVLEDLRLEIERLGSRYLFQSTEVDSRAEDLEPGGRIRALAELRNLAIEDLWEHPGDYSIDTTVIFLNDIAICLEDILELVHQRQYQGADMTCAMDWTYAGTAPTFYDVWIARGMTGDTFFDIPESGSWDNAWNLFWNDQKSRSDLMSLTAFQVFSCWNGVTAFTAKPLIEGKIKFRQHYDNECFQGEPKLFAKDMWYNGYGKIAVIPSVNVEYSDEAAQKIKESKGYTSQNIEREVKNSRIEWDPTPPALVKCMPDYSRQTFVPWDEGLPHHTNG